MHRILAEQLADGMIHPISKFLQADLESKPAQPLDALLGGGLCYIYPRPASGPIFPILPDNSEVALYLNIYIYIKIILKDK